MSEKIQVCGTCRRLITLCDCCSPTVFAMRAQLFPELFGLPANDSPLPPWRRPSENAAEQLDRRAGVVITDEGFTANVIEGERH